MRRLVLVVMVLALALVSCGGDDDGDDTPAETAPAPAAESEPSDEPPVPAADECDLDTVHDRFIGFRIGRPDGWEIDATGGAIVVKRDPAAGTVAVVYPVVPDGSADQTELFRAYGRVLSAAAEADGGGLKFKIDEQDERGVFGTVSGTFAGSEVSGSATVAPLEDQIVFSAYWAPSGELADVEDELAEVIACYRKEDGTPLRRHQGQAFAASLPEDWVVTGETQNGIDISSPGDDAGVSFAFVTNVPGATSAGDFRDYFFSQIPGLSQVELRATQDLGVTSDDFGTQWSQQATEFDATFEGRAVRGVATVAVGNTQYGTSGGLMSIRIAERDKYDEYAGVIAAIQESIVITSSGGAGGDGVSLAPNTPAENPLTSSQEYRDEVNDQLSQDWQEATMGFENVESPSTGEQYQAPLNSYDSAGPDGPGYYRELPGGGSELLQETAP